MEFLLLFFLPTQLGTYFFLPESFVHGVRVDYLALSFFLTDILAIGYVLLNIKYLKLKPFNTPALIIFVLILLNIVFALSPIISAFHYLKIGLFGLVSYIISKTKHPAKRTLQAFAFGALLQLVIAVAQFWLQHAIQGPIYFLGERYFTLSTVGIATIAIDGAELLRPYGTFSHPNSLGGFYVLLYTFALFYKPFQNFPKLKLLLLMSSAMLVLVSFSKAAIIAFALVSVLQLFSYKKICMFCIASRVLVLSVILGIFLTATGDPESFGKRIFLMQSSLDIISKHALVGVGLGNYIIAQGSIANPYPYSFLQPVHNIVLLLISELGLIFTGLIGYCIWHFRKNIKLTQIHLALILVICVTGMVDHYWITLQQNVLLIVVLFGLLQREKDMLK
ncbi:MAG: O-antigen ligase family protein [Weeksellaceae bacterium]